MGRLVALSLMVMDDETVFEPHSWLNWDSFRREFEKFNEEAHTLILWPLHAAMSHLKTEAEAEDGKLEPRFSVSTGDEREYYIEQQQRNWQYFDDQERFLRNMALVGFLSLLTHTLNEMLRAGNFVKRKKGSYRKQGDSEFTETWREFEKRFGIDFFEVNKDLVAFIEPLRHARNKIVHNGGEAHTAKHVDDIALEAGEEGYFDLSFSKAYPQFVDGEGFPAHIRITDEHLNAAIDSAIKLVQWVSEQLRAKELEADRAERQGQNHLP